MHRDWYDSLLEMDINKANVDEVLRGEIGRIFRRCLEDAGVFKTDAAGREAAGGLSGRCKSNSGT